MITIVALMALAFVTRYSGLDGTLGLAFARTGAFDPFFGTLIGWLGTASTGSDTTANVFFGVFGSLPLYNWVSHRTSWFPPTPAVV